MTLTREQRAMMAAHLCDIAAKALRSGDYDTGDRLSRYASWVLQVINVPNGHFSTLTPERDYRAGLTAAGLSAEGIDAACDAIARGEHPATSLPGMVAKMYDAATNGLPHEGTELTLFRVLDLLGCEVTP